MCIPQLESPIIHQAQESVEAYTEANINRANNDNVEIMLVRERIPIGLVMVTVTIDMKGNRAIITISPINNQ